jgi:hypothetical protein
LIDIDVDIDNAVPRDEHWELEQVMPKLHTPQCHP